MLIDQRVVENLLRGEETRRYALAVRQALTDGAPLRTSRLCTECGKVPDQDDHDHLLAETKTGPVVILGCEGYWRIDPNTVGIDHPNWQPAPVAEPPMTGRVDHSDCTGPDDHEYLCESCEQAQAADGNMLCDDCLLQIGYCWKTGVHFHVDPQAPACFLIP